MKKFLALLFMTGVSIQLFGQVITGTVYDKSSKSIIYSASVYFNGTSVGTLTDDKGNFRLDVSRYPTMPLTISAVGYYSVTLSTYSKEKPNAIYMNPKTFELNEVVIKERAHPLRRSENLTIFRNEFLGTSGNAMSCAITNEGDIRFRNSQANDSIIAYAVKPILIDNRALGYKITYFLDRFTYSKSSQTFMFEGKVFFSEDSSASESKKEYFDKKRNEVYRGSRMQFLRALWLNDLNSAGFSIRGPANEALSYSKVVVERGNNMKYLRYPNGIYVAYYSKLAKSMIQFHKEYVFFDATGYYEPDGLEWVGEMAKPRLGDMLPYGYTPKE